MLRKYFSIDWILCEDNSLKYRIFNFLGIHYFIKICFNNEYNIFYSTISLCWGLIFFHVYFFDFELKQFSFVLYSPYYRFRDECSPRMIDVDVSRVIDFANGDYYHYEICTLKEVTDEIWSYGEICDYNIYEGDFR